VPPTAESPAVRLAAALAALPVEVDDAWCEVASVEVPSYPGGLRPSATVTVAGAGMRGRGEHVAWTDAAHARLCQDTPALVPRGRHALGAWAAAMRERTAEPYARAALEAAAIDLALRQARTGLVRLARPLRLTFRYVVSFDRRPDPGAEARRQRVVAPGIDLKVDVDPDWPLETWRDLAAAGGIAVLDWKGSGTPAAHEAAHALFPDALQEDPRPGDVPWSAGLRARLALDATIVSAADVARAPVRPAAVNVKPARMGGVLEALACVAACEAVGIAVYLGGMFEVSVGRPQLHALAALLSPDGPNDVAPIGVGAEPPPRPERLVVDPEAVGFGARVV
jgi:L-alanine-DL-glutamate epimerase-like enolase superfamily enzyme